MRLFSNTFSEETLNIAFQMDVGSRHTKKGFVIATSFNSMLSLLLKSSWDACYWHSSRKLEEFF
jgi:hypothetical protein